MENSKTWRAVRLPAIIVAGAALLSACGGDDRESGSNSVAADSPSVALASDATMVFQITGLMVIVPPTNARDRVVVVLPQPRGVGAHVPLLGFMIPDDVSVPDELCLSDAFGQEARELGICYVELDKWNLEPFGAGGYPGTLSTLPPVRTTGLLNITDLSGGDFKVHSARSALRGRSEVVFLAGQLGAGTCKLARWTYERIGFLGIVGPSHHDSLANVVEWKISKLAAPRLVFRLKESQQAVVVDFPPGESRLVLAHVPVGDVPHLPPGRPATARPERTAHFHPYYDLLSKSNSVHDSLDHKNRRRRIPHDATGRPTPCELRISTGEKFIDGRASVATYACIVASAERGS